MNTTQGRLAAHVETLIVAEAGRFAVPPLTDGDEGLTVDRGYEIQAAIVEHKIAHGDIVVGAKLGLTSKAKQHAMNVDEPCYGMLLGSHVLGGDEPVQLDELIHPRAEPEIVFHLRDSLAGPGVTSHDVLAATAALSCGVEIIDSRYEDFRFTLADVVADNTSAARFILGPQQVDPRDIPDLSLVGCLLEVDGSLVSTASGAAVLGHPANAVALLANWLGARGHKLEAGWSILSGGLTNAVPLHAGTHLTARFGRLGCVSTRAV